MIKLNKYINGLEEVVEKLEEKIEALQEKQEAIEEWGIENVNKGYEIFDFDGTGMLQIEEIGATDAFGCDDDKATEQAMKDGIKIIPIDELPKNFDRRYLGWIDTPENRKAIEEYCQNESNYYCNGNSLEQQ